MNEEVKLIQYRNFSLGDINTLPYLDFSFYYDRLRIEMNSEDEEE